jgi:HD-GYP domain-containing protein (c-di-GMP phosphodiesterase class II)
MEIAIAGFIPHGPILPSIGGCRQPWSGRGSIGARPKRLTGRHGNRIISLKTMTSTLKKNKVNAILSITEALNQIKDIDSLLDRVLLEARRFSRADAGSIYLLENQKLRINFVQNDTLSKRESGNKFLYQNHALAINDQSMAGYVALTKKPLLIDDAYRLSEHVPYQFNRSFDDSASYHTRSVLTVPLIPNSGKLIGIMQIINAMDEHNHVIPFSNEDELVVAYFANHATGCIEKTKMTREIILRMIKIAELHDPEETAGHVNRVGAYAIELYSAWALKNNITDDERKNVRDILRIAAMLHDVGKVAISDLVLKKNGPLNAAEFDQMKGHVIMGARLFRDSTSDWDDMAAEIALNHHEKWDGTGYPGRIADIFSGSWHPGPGKKGLEIPLTARIVALADVYDALTSERAYKDGWPEDKILSHIRSQKGKHFDPELVDVFFSIYDVIRAIKNKYSEI